MALLQRTGFASLKRFTALVVIAIFGLNTTGWSQGRTDGGKRDIDVATINLYVGADFTPVVTLDPSDPNFGLKLLGAVSTIYNNIVASNFPLRADALARQIVARGSDLIALQEVTLIRRQSPGDAIAGGTTPATQVQVDYLAVLLDALQRHGGHYAVAAQVQDVDVEVPMAVSPTAFDDVRLTDRDVILVRTDLPPGHLRTSNPQGANFTAALPLPIGISVLRGWCSVDVQLRGRSFRFINTHLEDRLPPTLPDIQGMQALQLLAGPAGTTMPVVLAGDFNSDANGNYSSATYGLLTSGGGFTDAWNVGPGLTWGHDELLADPSVPFLYRLDLILFRGGNFEAADAEVVDPQIGATRPLWFSDHAGVFAKLSIQ